MTPIDEIQITIPLRDLIDVREAIEGALNPKVPLMSDPVLMQKRAFEQLLSELGWVRSKVIDLIPEPHRS